MFIQINLGHMLGTAVTPVTGPHWGRGWMLGIYPHWRTAKDRIPLGLTRDRTPLGICQGWDPIPLSTCKQKFAEHIIIIICRAHNISSGFQYDSMTNK